MLPRCAAILSVGLLLIAAGQFPPSLFRALLQPVALGCEPAGLAVADFNQDGKLDAAAACHDQDSVVILLGDGRGGFRLLRRLPVVRRPVFLAAGDLNGDGRPDVVAAQHAGGHDLAVLLGDRRGAFSAPPESPLRTLPSSHPHNHGLVLADINGDGHLDIITAHAGVHQGKVDASLSVLLGGRQARFRPARGSPVPIARLPSGVAVADLNGDGAPDLISTNEGARDITVVLNKGRGRFHPARHHAIEAGRYGGALTTGDWNGDGKLDLATLLDGSSLLVLWMGDGRGGFSRQQTLDVGRTCFAIVTADFNADRAGDLAIACVDSTVVLLLGNGTGGFAPAAGSPFPVGRDTSDILAADLDGDGRADLLLVSREDRALSVLLAVP